MAVSPTVGDTLQATDDITDLDGLTNAKPFVYEWYAAGLLVGTGNTYVVQQADADKAIYVKVPAFQDDLGYNEGPFYSAATDPVARLPNNPATGSVSIDNASPYVGDTVTASNTIADVDGITGVTPFTHKWYVGGTYETSGDTYVVQLADAGKTIQAKIDPFIDDLGNPENGPWESAVGNVSANQAATGSVSIDNIAPEVGDNITASNTIADADGITGATPFTYNWLLNGTKTTTGNTYTVVAGDVGKTIQATIDPFVDDRGFNEPGPWESQISAEVVDPVVPNNPATGGVSIDNTAPTVDDVITASNTIADLDGITNATPFTYNWLLDGTPTTTGNTYTVQAGDVGKTIQATIDGFVDDLGNSEPGPWESQISDAVIDPPTYEQWVKDFRTDLSLDEFNTTHRASWAMGADADGIQRTVADHVPIFIGGTWSGTEFTGTSEGMLIECSSTNLVTDTDAASWTPAGGTAAHHGTIVAPDGSLSAVHCVETGGAGTLVVSAPVTGEVDDTVSVWARTVSGTGTASLLGSQSETQVLADLTEEWQRFSFARETDPTTFYAVDMRKGVASLSELLIWLPQAEGIPFVTSGIETPGDAATRAVNKVIMSPSPITLPASGWCGHVSFANWTGLITSGGFFSVDDTLSTDSVRVQARVVAGSYVGVNTRARSNTTWTNGPDLVPDINAPIDLRVKVDGSTITLWVNGDKTSNELAGGAPSNNHVRFTFGNEGASFASMSALVNFIRLVPSAQSDEEIESWAYIEVGKPTITGVVAVDEVLSVDTDTVIDYGNKNGITYSWSPDSSTGSTYTVQDGDTDITVSISYTDDNGHAKGPIVSHPVNIASGPEFVYDFSSASLAPFELVRAGEATAQTDTSGELVVRGANLPLFPGANWDGNDWSPATEALPKINTSPVSVSTTDGGNETFSIVASGVETAPRKTMMFAAHQTTETQARVLVDEAFANGCNDVGISIERYGIQFINNPWLADLQDGYQYLWTTTDLSNFITYVKGKGMTIFPMCNFTKANGFFDNDETIKPEHRYNNLTLDPNSATLWTDLGPLVDEIITYFSDDRFHIGTDESVGWKENHYKPSGALETDQSQLPAADHQTLVLDAITYLEARGKKVWLWHDMLTELSEHHSMTDDGSLHVDISTGGADPRGEAGYGKAIRDNIPRSVSVHCWHYFQNERPYSTPRMFSSEGFAEVSSTTWRNDNYVSEGDVGTPTSINSFSRAMALEPLCKGPSMHFFSDGWGSQASFPAMPNRIIAETTAAWDRDWSGYKWEISKDGGDTWLDENVSGYSGLNTATLALSATAANNGDMVRCTVRNFYGPSRSEVATVEVI